MTDAILDQLIDNQHIQGFVLEQDNLSQARRFKIPASDNLR